MRPASLLKLLRQSEGLSSKQMANDVLEINQWDYSRVENLTMRPSQRVRKILERRYRCPISKLLAPARVGLFPR